MTTLTEIGSVRCHPNKKLNNKVARTMKQLAMEMWWLSSKPSVRFDAYGEASFRYSGATPPTAEAIELQLDKLKQQLAALFPEIDFSFGQRDYVGGYSTSTYLVVYWRTTGSCGWWVGSQGVPNFNASVEPASGKAKCALCGKAIEVGSRAIQIPINGMASPYFHANCLWQVAARTDEMDPMPNEVPAHKTIKIG
jgi:hypothetical protein